MTVGGSLSISNWPGKNSCDANFEEPCEIVGCAGTAVRVYHFSAPYHYATCGNCGQKCSVGVYLCKNHWENYPPSSPARIKSKCYKTITCTACNGYNSTKSCPKCNHSGKMTCSYCGNIDLGFTYSKCQSHGVTGYHLYCQILQHNGDTLYH